MTDIDEKFKTGYVSAKSGNIITPIFRADWVYLLKPTKDRIEEGVAKPGYYSIDLVFPAFADFTLLKKAMQEKLNEKFGNKIQSPEFVAKLRIPLKDQAEKLDKDGNMRPGYVKGQKVITSTAKKEYKPGLVDSKGNDIIEPMGFYAGCWAIASLSPFAFDNKIKGVSLGLRHVQLVRYPQDSEMPFGGGGSGGHSTPNEDFEPIGDLSTGAATGKGAGSIFD